MLEPVMAGILPSRHPVYCLSSRISTFLLSGANLLTNQWCLAICSLLVRNFTSCHTQTNPLSLNSTSLRFSGHRQNETRFLTKTAHEWSFAKFLALSLSLKLQKLGGPPLPPPSTSTIYAPSRRMMRHNLHPKL